MINLKHFKDAAKLSLSSFLAGEGNDPFEAPPTFTAWLKFGEWAVALYEPELVSTADARTVLNYEGKRREVINLCSYNYLGLANRPEVIAAAVDALKKYGLARAVLPCFRV